MFGHRTLLRAVWSDLEGWCTCGSRRRRASGRQRSRAARGQASIIIINFLFITLTCNAETWNGVTKSNSEIYCCHGRVALSKAYKYNQLRELCSRSGQARSVRGWRAAPPRLRFRKDFLCRGSMQGCGAHPRNLLSLFSEWHGANGFRPASSQSGGSYRFRAGEVPARSRFSRIPFPF